MPTMNHREVTTTEAVENILKTILKLHIRCGHAYVSEIAEELEMNLTTTYTIISQMAKDGLLQPMEGGRGRRAKKQSMTFTPEGEARANGIFDRHQTIQKWLNRLGISMEDAEREACGLEHGMSDRTMRLLKNHVRMATEITKGKQENAMETMRCLMEQQSNVREEQTFAEETMRLLEAVGGTEGIARKRELLDRAQGEERLEELLDLVDQIGGLDQLREKYKAYQRLEAVAEEHGGLEAVQNKLKLAEQLNGEKGMKKLLQLSELYGGVQALTEQAEKQYQSWETFFRTDHRV